MTRRDILINEYPFILKKETRGAPFDRSGPSTNEKSKNNNKTKQPNEGTFITVLCFKFTN